MRRGAAEGALALALACLVPQVAQSHGRSTSTSSFDVIPGDPTTARIVLRAPWSDLQRAVPGLGESGPTPEGVDPERLARVDRYLEEHVLLRADGEACAVTGPASPVPTTDPTHLGRSWRVICASRGPLAIESTAFFDVRPQHVHLARIRQGEGPAVEQLLVRDRPRITLPPTESAQATTGSGLLDYVKLGIGHIFTGADHLCFLLALLLIGATLREVAMVVTGFTAAHSLTLALGVLGVVRPASAAVEALIGLSIVVVALENFLETTGDATRRLVRGGLALLLAGASAGALVGRFAVPALALAGVGIFSLCYFELLARAERPARLRWLVAFVFGLVHGFGFAGVLAETALPAGRMAQALLGFNLGVEIGQLSIVATLWPLYRLLLARLPDARSAVIQLGSAVVLAAGLFWFLSRAMGAA
jgi:hypothetical protein